MIIKVIGSVLIVCCSLIIGMKEKSKLTQRVSLISDIIHALDFIHSEIACMCTPTEEILDRLCEKTKGELHNFFNDCRMNHLKRRDLPLGMIWSRAVKDATYLELSQNERTELLELGNVLGRYNTDEELRVIEHSRKNFEAYLKTAESNSNRLGRLYGNLSIICGIALVIILL